MANTIVEPASRGNYTQAGIAFVVVGIDMGTVGEGKTATTLVSRGVRFSEIITKSKAFETALRSRIGKRGFTEVGYQFPKHAGRFPNGNAWRRIIPEGATKNPETFNRAGGDYE